MPLQAGARAHQRTPSRCSSRRVSPPAVVRMASGSDRSRLLNCAGGGHDGLVSSASPSGSRPMSKASERRTRRSWTASRVSGVRRYKGGVGTENPSGGLATGGGVKSKESPEPGASSMSEDLQGSWGGPAVPLSARSSNTPSPSAHTRRHERLADPPAKRGSAGSVFAASGAATNRLAEWARRSQVPDFRLLFTQECRPATRQGSRI